eukprot:scaffold449512_cov17-Prasinocladus_malaysianus.AAC.1
MWYRSGGLTMLRLASLICDYTVLPIGRRVRVLACGGAGSDCTSSSRHSLVRVPVMEAEGFPI